MHVWTRSVIGSLLALMLLAAGPASAQETRAITFEEAIKIALRQNSTLRQTANAVAQQQITVSDRRMAFVPNLSLSTGAGQTYGRTVDRLENRIVTETAESFNASLSTGINVFNGFRDVAALKQARYALEASDLQYDRSRQTVVFQVLSSFLDLIQRGEQILIQEENLEAQRQQLAQIEAFVEVGSRPVSDLYQQQASVANAELLLLNARRAHQLSQVNLIQLLQLDPFGNYTFVAPSMDGQALEGRAYAIEELLRQAFANRPDLEAQVRTIDAAEEGVRIARSTAYPSVNLSVGYGSGWTSIGLDPLTGKTESFLDQFDRKRGGNLSLNLSFPIFDRFATRNSTQRARVDYENARLGLETLRHDIALQVRQAYLDYLTAEKRLDVTAQQERAASRALEAAQERYNVGAGNIVELTQARASYVQAASDRAAAQYDFLFQERLIEYHLGVLEPENGSLR